MSWVKYADEISERLDYVPARFIVHRHIRPQFNCPHCETVVSEELLAQHPPIR